MGGRKEEGGWVEIYCCGGMRGMNSVGGVLLRGNGRQEMQFSGLCRSGEMFSGLCRSGAMFCLCHGRPFPASKMGNEKHSHVTKTDRQIKETQRTESNTDEEKLIFFYSKSNTAEEENAG